jgi:hypothetical protein
VSSAFFQLSRLTNHDSRQPSRHHRTASCLATCKGSFWRYACREFSHQRPPDIVTDHPHVPCMGSRAIFHAIQILMEPWFPMCWACVCDILVPGAVELLPRSSRASRLLGWGAIGAEQGRKQVAPKTNGLHGSQTPRLRWQSGSLQSPTIMVCPRPLVEVWKLEDRPRMLSAQCSLLAAECLQPIAQEAQSVCADLWPCQLASLCLFRVGENSIEKRQLW